MENLLTFNTWEWSGFQWSHPQVQGPPQRSHYAMSSHAEAGKTVLFGGVAVQALGDTWAWNGAVWTQIASSGPGARDGHAMAYDSSRRRIVLFGGRLGSTNAPVGDTWELAIVSAPTLTAHPQSQAVQNGAPAVFSVVAAGIGPLSYQWRKDGTPLGNGGPVFGATSPQLVITGASTAWQGSYDVAVSNTCGVIPSNSAVLSVLCYANCNGDTTPTGTPSLTVADFGCFQTKFAQSAPYADCNQDGVLTVADFGCFQSKFVLGCP